MVFILALFQKSKGQTKPLASYLQPGKDAVFRRFLPDDCTFPMTAHLTYAQQGPVGAQIYQFGRR